jgi:LPPG:FO 2-phospho-L-lactate transferase
VNGHVLALAGGVGGAKLVSGFASILPPKQFTVVANTGDDEVFHGLHVSPDLDTIMYTLAGLANPTTGWGLAQESFNALEMLKRYQLDTWFTLGDGDLATHIERTRLLNQGHSLSEVTRHLCERLGVQIVLAPMSDQPVRTILNTDEGNLAFQDYFVRRQYEPIIKSVDFHGAKNAQASAVFQQAMNTTQAVVFCPSNPIVSIGPILAVPGVSMDLERFSGLRLAVSPIVGDEAIRGPAAKIMRELGEDASCVGVAKRLSRICDVMVIDTKDSDRIDDIKDTGLEPVVLDTIMNTDADKKRLAVDIMKLIEKRLR